MTMCFRPAPRYAPAMSVDSDGTYWLFGGMLTRGQTLEAGSVFNDGSRDTTIGGLRACKTADETVERGCNLADLWKRPSGGDWVRETQSDSSSTSGAAAILSHAFEGQLIRYGGGKTNLGTVAAQGAMYRFEDGVDRIRVYFKSDESTKPKDRIQLGAAVHEDENRLMFFSGNPGGGGVAPRDFWVLNVDNGLWDKEDLPGPGEIILPTDSPTLARPH